MLLALRKRSLRLSGRKGGDYILNVKANQPDTSLELEEHFKPFYKGEI